MDKNFYNGSFKEALGEFRFLMGSKTPVSVYVNVLTKSPTSDHFHRHYYEGGPFASAGIENLPLWYASEDPTEEELRARYWDAVELIEEAEKPEYDEDEDEEYEGEKEEIAYQDWVEWFNRHTEGYNEDDIEEAFGFEPGDEDALCQYFDSFGNIQDGSVVLSDLEEIRTEKDPEPMRKRVREIIDQQLRDGIYDDLIEVWPDEDHTIYVGHETVYNGIDNPLTINFKFQSFANDWLKDNDPNGFFPGLHIEKLGDMDSMRKYIKDLTEGTIAKASYRTLKDWVKEYNEEC